jgi:hypothetical protein
MANWGSGMALFTRLAVGSRKENTRVMASSQNPGDVLGLLDIENFTSTAWIGRIESPSVAADALKLLKVPTGEGYEQILHGLSPLARRSDGGKRAGRQFAMRDYWGRVEVTEIDLRHTPGLLAAIDSTPGFIPATRPLQPVPA